MFLACHLFTSSVHTTEHLIRSIIGFKTFELDSHFDHVSFNKQFHHQQLGATFDEEFNQLLTLFDPMQQRAILQAKDSNISSWLSILPLAESQFDLSILSAQQEFRDGLALHYKKTLLSLPSVCDGYGVPFNIEHALDCCFVIVGIMRFGMLLVTLLLWLSFLLLRSQLCKMDPLMLIL